MRKENLFGIVSDYWYIVESSTGRLMYSGIGFYDHDEAIVSLVRLQDANPSKEYQLVLGGYDASEIYDE